MKHGYWNPGRFHSDFERLRCCHKTAKTDDKPPCDGDQDKTRHTSRETARHRGAHQVTSTNTNTETRAGVHAIPYSLLPWRTKQCDTPKLRRTKNQHAKNSSTRTTTIRLEPFNTSRQKLHHQTSGRESKDDCLEQPQGRRVPMIRPLRETEGVPPFQDVERDGADAHEAHDPQPPKHREVQVQCCCGTSGRATVRSRHGGVEGNVDALSSPRPWQKHLVSEARSTSFYLIAERRECPSRKSAKCTYGRSTTTTQRRDENHGEA